ncbi:polyhedrin [Inachis io cypovirus 2]|uniref:Polyhedrin n=1 Tax=Inachis io cypovirus 2 TaxID=1382295 RepID=W6EJ73_9REOV|nr:polyhedrin [Inachis io cypovirus 2]AHJ14800.1 polyhedrin [Inachis io cypovirus 2]
MPYDVYQNRDDDLRLRQQHLRDREIEVAPTVPGASIKALIILKYKDGRYKIYNLTSTAFINVWLGYDDLVWYNNHSYCKPVHGSKHNMQAFNNIDMDYSGEGSPPYDITYPYEAMVILNGNYNIDEADVFACDEDGQTHRDWHLSRDIAPGAISHNQWKQLGMHSWYTTVSLCQDWTLEVVLPVKDDKAYSLANPRTIFRTLIRNVVKSVIRRCTGEREVIDYCRSKKLNYPVAQLSLLPAVEQACMATSICTTKCLEYAITTSTSQHGYGSYSYLFYSFSFSFINIFIIIIYPSYYSYHMFIHYFGKNHLI